MQANRAVLRPRVHLQNVQNDQENLLRGKTSVLPAKPAGQRGVLGDLNKNVVAVTKPSLADNSVVISKPKKVVEAKTRTTSNAAFNKPNLVVRSQSTANAKSLKPLPSSTTTAATATAVKSTDSFPSSAQKIEDIDKDDRDDPFQVVTYVNDIYNYMRELEVKYSIRPQHLVGQLHVTSKMRSILVDWLVEVHQQFHLLLETLYLTVAIIDLYLQEVNETTKNTLQLVGVASMFLACKYEEMYSPEVSDFVYITDNAYTKEEIFKMECKILQVLKFNLGRPVPITFFRRFSKAAHRDAVTHTMGKFLLELSIVDYELCHYPPSLLAAASIYLAVWLFSSTKKSVWNKTMVHYSNYSLKDILPIAKKLALIVLNLNSSKYKAVPRKYSSSKFFKISLRPELRTPQLKMFAES